MTITMNPITRWRERRTEDQVKILRALDSEWRHELDLLDEFDIPATERRWGKAIKRLIAAGEIEYRIDEEPIEPGSSYYNLSYRLSDG